jgi:hypothetical protein
MQNGKFLWVTHAQPKKRTVTCKHVFDSILVLGNATAVLTNAERSDVAPVDGSSHRDREEGTAAGSSLHHYGASSRTVDGGNHRRASAKFLHQKRSPAMMRASSVKSPSSTRKTELPRPVKEDTSQEKETNLSSSEESSEVEVPDADTSSQAQNRRRSSRASALRPVRYNDQEYEYGGDDPSNHPRRGLETPELVQQGRWLPRIQRAHLEAQSRRDELVPDLIVRQPDLPMLSIVRHFLPLLLLKSMSKSIRISAMGEQLLE